MNAKHAPGPWTDDDDGWIGGPNGVEVCCYAGCGSHEAEWSNPADKTLAIAAPELLEALILLEAEMVASGNASSVDYGWKPAIEKTRAAIAKATGEQA
jgi:hypothetical protein